MGTAVLVCADTRVLFCAGPGVLIRWSASFVICMDVPVPISADESSLLLTVPELVMDSVGSAGSGLLSRAVYELESLTKLAVRLRTGFVSVSTTEYWAVDCMVGWMVSVSVSELQTCLSVQ